MGHKRLYDDEESNHEDGINTVLLPNQQKQVIPQTTAILNIKLLILKKEEYDIWAMKMEHYLEYIDNDVWKRSGNHQKLGFGVMQIQRKWKKAGYQTQFEAFKISIQKGLNRDMTDSKNYFSLKHHVLKYQLRIANHKVSQIFAPKHGVFEQEIQGASKTSSCAQNVAFVSQSKSSTNKVKSGFTGAYSTCTPSTSSTNIPEKEVLAGFADEIAMIAIRMKKFYKKTGRRVRVDGKTHAKGTNEGKRKETHFNNIRSWGKAQRRIYGLAEQIDDKN
ncbi:hypothetical protein Tco_1292536 [Tanacetum coccineum]